MDDSSLRDILRRPSAILPLLMSFAALSIVLGHVFVYGAAREPDEGTAAHIWQLLMGLQLPILGFFVTRWLPKAPRQTMVVLGMQAVAALASLAPVVYLHL
jgi:hypothetical protein